jgi:hypothetical protein
VIRGERHANQQSRTENLLRLWKPRLEPIPKVVESDETKNASEGVRRIESQGLLLILSVVFGVVWACRDNSLGLEDFVLPRSTLLEFHQFPPNAQISVVSILGFVCDCILFRAKLDGAHKNRSRNEFLYS